MCGLFGAVIYNRECAAEPLTERIAKAQSIQAHRGPDMQDCRVFNLDNATVVLAHQRLSILDLSENGRQPMAAADKKNVIVFNGEVYNYRELAQQGQLQGLQSETDTEVILELLSLQNYGETLNTFNGMWAIAMLDLQNEKLLLSRDRAGVKPLYYTVLDGNLYFSSEIKTLLVLTGQRFPLNLGVVGKYLEQALQDDTRETFFDGIWSFPAGEFAILDLAKPQQEVISKPYWNPFVSKSFDYSSPEATFRQLFEDAVRLRLRADVPVGVTLSGGLDSSLICQAVHQQLQSNDFFVLSAVSPGSPGDESYFVDMVASYYGLAVNKVDLRWSSDETLALMHKTTWHNDAPLGSLSNVAFYLLMSKADELGVKVILSGQGADELLCGYKKYLGFYIKHLINDKCYFKALRVVLEFCRNGTVLNQFGWAEAKRYLGGRSVSKGSVLSLKTKAALTKAPLGAIGRTLADRQWQDYRRYSVPYLTHYEDRMSMAFGREIRLPFLDYRLVEYLLNAPIELKLNKGWTKYLLRVAYEALLPRGVIWRKDKQGFTNPQESWLRNELKPVVESYFSPSSMIFEHDLVDRQRLLKKYENFCARRGHVWYREVFNPLGLEVWLREFKDYIRAS